MNRHLPPPLLRITGLGFLFLVSPPRWSGLPAV